MVGVISVPISILYLRSFRHDGQTWFQRYEGGFRKDGKFVECEIGVPEEEEDGGVQAPPRRCRGKRIILMRCEFQAYRDEL